MKKAILLVRVSTERQEYEEQKKQLIVFAVGKGYHYSENDNKSEMLIIEHKESATKLADKDRKGLTEMWDAINNHKNKIECVFCWELSRLSRKPTTLYTIKDELVKRQINLCTKFENLTLLVPNPEKKGELILDPSANMIFGIFVSMCENEIIQRLERGRRGKEANANNGKYNGGLFIKYGYIVEKDTNKYIIDESKRELIKTLYELYSTGKYGVVKLHKEMISRGFDVNIRTINKILRSEEYTGEQMPIKEYSQNIKGNVRIIHRFSRKYPPIISLKLYEQCRNVANKNNNNIDKSKNIYYASKLIKCSCCGSALVALKNNVVYRCMHKYSVITKKECWGTDSININVIDSILWETAKKLEIDFMLNFDEKRFIEWNNQMTILQSKIDNSDNQYDVILEKKIKDLRKLLPIDVMNDELLKDTALKATKEEKQRIEQEKVKYQSDIERLQKLKIEIEKKYNPTTSENPTIEEAKAAFRQFSKNRAEIESEINKSDETKRYEIIHNHIKEVSITNVPGMKATKLIKITYFDNLFDPSTIIQNDEILQPTNECFHELYYSYRLKDKTKQLFFFFDNEKHYSNIEIEQRFTK